MLVEPAIPADLLAAIRAPFVATGAQPTDTAILQPLGLMLDLAGESLRARLFVVQAEGGQEACLRADFTAPIARAHIESGESAGNYLYEGKVFRASPDRANQAEEFVQIGVERFGPAGPTADADFDMIMLGWRAAMTGGRRDLSLWLGDVSLFAAFVDGLALSPVLGARIKRAASRPRLLQAELARAGQEAGLRPDNGLARILGGLSPDAAGAALEEVWSLAGIQPVGGRTPAEIAQRLIQQAEGRSAPALTRDQAAAISAFLAVQGRPSEALDTISALAPDPAGELQTALRAWRTQLERLVAAGVAECDVTFSTALGHAFDYYDGMTFEVRSAGLDPQDPIAAGGRYDGLLSRLGGAGEDGPSPGAAVRSRAIGCMVRPARAMEQVTS